MLPRKEHLKQINRFHDKVEQLDKLIESETDPTHLLELHRQYHKLTSKVWNSIDNCIDSVKNNLDNL